MHRVLINNLSEPDEFTVVDDNYRPVSGEIDLTEPWIEEEHPNIRHFISGDAEEDNLTRRLVELGLLER